MERGTLQPQTGSATALLPQRVEGRLSSHPATSPANGKHHSSANEKLSSSGLLVSSSELSFFPCGFGVLWEPDSWFINGCLLSVSSQGRWHKRALWGLLYRGTDPSHGGSRMTSSPPKSLSPDSITLGVRISTCELGWTQTFSPWHCPSISLQGHNHH